LLLTQSGTLSPKNPRQFWQGIAELGLGFVCGRFASLVRKNLLANTAWVLELLAYFAPSQRQLGVQPHVYKQSNLKPSPQSSPARARS
jgi:hypothetical protein